MSGRPEGRGAPLVTKTGPLVDPLPQALILTAIVIGFGVIAYLVILLYRTFLDQHTANTVELFDPKRTPPSRREDAR
jgi:multicomponent Na+:H+ antiporter subunit C